MQIDVNSFFVAEAVPEICVRKKHKFQNQLDVFFCYSLNIDVCHNFGIKVFWPRAMLKCPERSFVVVVVVLVGGESFWSEQKIFALEQKKFLEQKNGIEMSSFANFLSCHSNVSVLNFTMRLI